MIPLDKPLTPTKADDLFDLAVSVGGIDSTRAGGGVSRCASSAVAAGGRPGGVDGAPGLDFSLPDTRVPLRFGVGRTQPRPKPDEPPPNPRPPAGRTRPYAIGEGVLYDFPARGPLPGDPLGRPRRW